MLDYFALLGVPRSATDAEIKEAYRRLAKKYHPDANHGESDPEQMQRLNDAKAILVDRVRREEHRTELNIRERLTAERLRALRERNFPKQIAQAPPTQWDKHRTFFLYTLLGAAVIAITWVVAIQASHHDSALLDPITQIIARHSRDEQDAFIVRPIEKPEVDTVAISDDSLPKLKRKAEIFLGIGEYKSAIRYYELCLRKGETNDTIVRNLSLAYFKRGKYAQSLRVLSKQMHGDSNLVVAYYNIGRLFLNEEKPMDARDAFAEAVSVGDKMYRENHIVNDFAIRAKRELARLE